jgi:CubicO group peptidase (beta-lactamase class C family)
MATTDWPLFEHYVEQAMKENHIVGAAVAVADESQLLYARGFGVKDLESQDPVTPETIFGCASVSKSFTAMAIAQLAGQGMLAVDNPVIEHIPEFRLVGMKDMCDVKIRHILSHTTGLPPMTRRQDIIDLDEHLRYIASAEYELLGEPGEYFSYCNDTFLLNGLIIQRKSGQLYRRYMTRHILDAAGMNRSTYNLEELEKMGNLSTPYSYNSNTKTHDKQN